MLEFEHTKSAMCRAERIEKLTANWGPNCFFPGCGKPFLKEEDITFDHWIPQSKGGTWEISNLRMMHKRCNALKGDRMPNEDGTLPPHPREFKVQAVDKSLRVPVCETCESGRLLIMDEICEICGSTPQPAAWPAYLQKTPKECDHSTFHCWMCVLDFIPRKTATERIAFG